MMGIENFLEFWETRGTASERYIAHRLAVPQIGLSVV
jgi:hypothetical protein